MKKIFYILSVLILSTISASANHIILGNGSGTFVKTSMGSLNPGDTILVAPGTYTGGYNQLNNLTGIVIMPNGGIVNMVQGSFLDFENNTQCKLQGINGGAGVTYGFRSNITVGTVGGILYGGFDYKDTIEYIEFYGQSTQSCFDNGTNLTTYDGINSNTKRLLQCRIDNIWMHNTNNFESIFHNQHQNVEDSCEYANFIIDSCNVVRLWSANAVYHPKIHDWVISATHTTNDGTDNGMIFFAGCGGGMSVYNNTRIGGNWGWFMRVTLACLNDSADVYIYNNLQIGSYTYGFCDIRGADTSGNSAPNIVFRFPNVRVYNNTIGNMRNQNGYITGIVYYGQLPPYKALYGVNNLKFNSTNYTGVADSIVIINFGSPPDNNYYLSDNKYYTDVIGSNVLNDTTHTFAPTATSPLNGAGNNIVNPPVSTDGLGHTQTNPPVIGARVYVSSSTPIANAGSDQTITLPTNSVTLDGSASTDIGGTITSYAWSQISGPNTATLGTPNNVTTSASGLIAGTYVFNLLVTDNNSNTSSDQVSIIVNNPISPSGSILLNRTKLKQKP